MMKTLRKWMGVCAALALMPALSLPAGAVGATLELVEVPVFASGIRTASMTPEEQALRSAMRSASFRMQLDEAGRPMPDREFSRVVKKEPAAYACAFPFKGVLRVGEKSHAFVFDSTDLAGSGYHRLYFDRNGNGDLTDDAALEARPAVSRAARAGGLGEGLLGRSLATVRTSSSSAPSSATPSAPATVVPARRAPSSAYFSHTFPELELSAVIDGKNSPFRVRPGVNASLNPEEEGAPRYAIANFQAGLYRRGEIELDGQSHTVILVDSNCNGRFDDAVQFRTSEENPTERVQTIYGDSLVVVGAQPVRATVGVSLLDGRYVAPLYRVGESTYRLEVSPSGDRIALDGSGIRMGKVKAPSPKFSGILFGEQGFAQVTCADGEAVEVPAGEWRLLSYTIDMSTETVEAAPTSALRPAARNTTRVSAAGTAASKSFTVRPGRTTDLPCGGPYRTEVAAVPMTPPRGQEGTFASLRVSFIGQGGEVLTALSVGGRSPTGPTFIMADATGRKVDAGAFQFG